MNNKEFKHFPWQKLASVNNGGDYIYLDYGNRRFEITENVGGDTDYIYDVNTFHRKLSVNFSITRDTPFRTIEGAKLAVESFILEELK